MRQFNLRNSEGVIQFMIWLMTHANVDENEAKVTSAFEDISTMTEEWDGVAPGLNSSAEMLLWAAAGFAHEVLDILIQICEDGAWSGREVKWVQNDFNIWCLTISGIGVDM